MPPRKDKSTWAPYGLAGLKPSLPDQEIIEKLRKSSKYFSKILGMKEKNDSVLAGFDGAGVSKKIEKAVKETEELRNNRLKYAIWMESLVNDSYFKKCNDEIDVLIACNVIKIVAISCSEIPFRDKETASIIFDKILDIIPKVVDLNGKFFFDYYEILFLIYNCDIETMITDWIGISNLKLTEKLLTSIIKCAEVILPQNASLVIQKRRGNLATLTVRLLEQVFNSMVVCVDTIDVLFYYLVPPQKTNFKMSYELCCKALSKDGSTNVIVQATNIIRNSLTHDTIFNGKRTGNKLFHVITSLEYAVPGFITDIYEDIQKLVVLKSNDNARTCIWMCASNPNSNLINRITDPKHVFQYITDWNDGQKMMYTTLLGKILENHTERSPYIDAFVSSLFKDDFSRGKLEMFKILNKIAGKDPLKISDKIYNSIGRLVSDPDDDIRQKSMMLLANIHQKLVINDSPEDVRDNALYSLSSFFNYLNHSCHADVQRLEKLFVSDILATKFDNEQKLDILEKLYICWNSNGIFTFRVIMRNRSRLFEMVTKILMDFDEKGQITHESLKKDFNNMCGSDFYSEMPKILEALKKSNIFEEILNIYKPANLSISQIQNMLVQFLQKFAEINLDNDVRTNFRKLIERSAPLFMDFSFGYYLITSLLYVTKTCKKEGILRIYYLTSVIRIISENFAYYFLSDECLQELFEVVECFDVEPASECGMYILKNIVSSNVKVGGWASDRRNELQKLINKVFYNGSPKAVEDGVFVLFKILPTEDHAEVTSKLGREFGEQLKDDSPQRVRSLAILTGLAVYSMVKNVSDNVWEDIVNKGNTVITNGFVEVVEDYRNISNIDMREAIMDPASKVLTDFEKKFSYGARHNGLRVPLSKEQFVAFPLYSDTSCNNIIYAIKLVCKTIENRCQKNVNLTKEVADLLKYTILEGKEYWDNFSEDQESSIKYYMSKYLVKLRNNRDLDVLLDYGYVAAASRCLYETKYDARSRFVVKIIKYIMQGGAPIIAILPLVLMNNKYDVEKSVEEAFRNVVLKAFAYLIKMQQRMTHLCKDKPLYFFFFHCEYAVAFTIICLALMPEYGTSMDVNMLKRSLPTLEAIMFIYKDMSSILNHTLIKDILSELRTFKLAIVREKRTKQRPIIEVDRKIWALAELCLALGEKTLDMFKASSQTAPDVVFQPTLFKKIDFNYKDMTSIQALINEIVELEKKPSKIGDIVHSSLETVSKNKAKRKNVRAKPTTASKKNVKAQEIIDDESTDNEVNVEESIRPVRGRKKQNKKVIRDNVSKAPDNDNEQDESVNKINKKKKTINKEKPSVNKPELRNNTQASKNTPTVGTRVTRSRNKNINNVPSENIVPSDLDDEIDKSIHTTPKASKNLESRNVPRVTRSGKPLQKIVEKEHLSIENVSIISPVHGDQEIQTTSLYDMVDKAGGKGDRRKRPALRRNQENAVPSKRGKPIMKPPLASSTPYHAVPDPEQRD
uniref:Condensin complex subunit 1 n=1 Tax=Parastrongyloides trichosuri TaxID=131310 RepID=A0A0N4ZWT9_PARTI